MRVFREAIIRFARLHARAQASSWMLQMSLGLNKVNVWYLSYDGNYSIVSCSSLSRSIAVHISSASFFAMAR